MIYFIRSPEGPIKIGTTIRLSERLKQLAIEHGPGLEVLAVVDGSYEAERELHGRFAHLRTVGEWFEPGSDLLGFIVADGKPWDRSDDAVSMVSVKIDARVVEDCRIAASFKGMTLSEYLSESMRQIAGWDIDAGYAQRAEAKGAK